MMILITFFKFFLGVVFGSFVAALTYRFPRGMSIASGRSFCDKCKKQISWFDNIPIFSFIFLLGKCRYCKEKISLRYPLIEIVSGLGFLFIGLNPIYLLLFLILLSILIIDFENQVIPDMLVFAGILLSFFVTNGFVFSNILAGFISSLFLLFVHLVTKGRGMGLGDVKFAVLGGMIVGLPLSPIWLVLAFLTGATYGIILILRKKAVLKSKIAFGPFLIISIPLTLIWGQKILDLIFLK